MIDIAFFFLLRPGEYTGTQSTESTPFAFVTYNCSKVQFDWTSKQPPTPLSWLTPLPHSHFQTRRTASVVKLSAWATVVTPIFHPPCAWSAASYTCTTTTPHQQHRLRRYGIRVASPSNPSRPLTLQPPSGRRAKSSALNMASTPKTSRRAPYAPPAPWHSSVPKSIRTSSSSLAAGDLMR